MTIALGMSEPEAGSDVAAVTTRARPADGGWIIDGQKMFTTNGHIADYVFLLARTDPESERHRGLTTFLVPLHTEGFEAQGVFTVSGERTNITFYGEMFLEDRWRISDVGAGWSSLMLALQDEHSAPFSSHLDRLLEHAEAWAAEPGPDGTAPIEREEVQRRLIRAATDLEVSQLLEVRSTWMESIGEVPVAEGPMSKLYSTESVVRHAEALTSLGRARCPAQPPRPHRARRRPHRARAALLARHDDLRRHQRDPAQHHCPTPLRVTPLLRRTP